MKQQFLLFAGFAALVTIMASLGSAALFSASADEMRAPSAIIKPQADIVTMVNVLTPQKASQAEIIELLQMGMENTMSRQPGFISASIHRSVDSDHVVVYAQWKSQEHINDVIKLVEAGKAPEMVQAFSLAAPDFHPYEVHSVHTPKKH